MIKLEIKLYFNDERGKHGPQSFSYSAEAFDEKGENIAGGYGKTLVEAFNNLEFSLEHS